VNFVIELLSLLLTFQVVVLLMHFNVLYFHRVAIFLLLFIQRKSLYFFPKIALSILHRLMGTFLDDFWIFGPTLA